jgi:pSer/pThr/pTyr-binding forkhead associated (FHA) protein
MAKVFLKFNTAVIKEIELTKDETTFGRKPNNDIVIDNPAISGFHGKIVKEGTAYAVEDLNSTNGTFLNGQRVKRAFLKNKDQIGIARHVLEFSLEAPKPREPLPDPDAKTYAPEIKATAAETAPPVNPEKSAQLDMLRQSLGITPKEAVEEKPKSSTSAYPFAEKNPSSLPPLEQPQAPPPPPPAGTGPVIKVIAGGVNGQNEFKIKDLVTYIGTSDQAAVKIKGLLAPSLAAAISRRPDGYFLKAVKAGYPKVNGKPVNEQILLENGALIEAGATNMVFYLPEAKKTSE